MEQIDEGLLLNASIAIGIFGIILLFVTSRFIGPDFGNIPDSLNTAALGEQIVVEGIVKSSSSGQNFSRIMLSTDTLVVVFGNVTVDEGSGLQVTGRVESYEGKKEIVADSIILSGK